MPPKATYWHIHLKKSNKTSHASQVMRGISAWINTMKKPNIKLPKKNTSDLHTSMDSETLHSWLGSWASDFTKHEDPLVVGFRQSVQLLKTYHLGIYKYNTCMPQQPCFWWYSVLEKSAGSLLPFSSNFYNSNEHQLDQKTWTLLRPKNQDVALHF